MTLRFKLSASIIFLVLLSMAIAITGYVLENKVKEISTESMRVNVHLHNLYDTTSLYAVNIVDAAHKVRNGTMSWDEGIQNIQSALAGINKAWTPFLETEEIPEVRDTLSALEKKANTAAQTLLGLMKQRDQAGLDQFVVHSMYPAIDPFGTKVGEIFLEHLQESDEHGELLIHEADQGVFIFKALTGLALVFGSALIWYIASGVTSPLRRVSELMQSISGGNTNCTVPNQQRKDEIGNLSRSLEVFRQNLIETEQLRAEQERLKAQAELDKRATMQKLADDFEAAVRGVVNAVAKSATDMTSFAKTLNATADETSSRAGNVAAASEQAAANVSTVATATEELSSSIAEITRQVSDSSRTAGAAVEEARNTNKVVSTMAQAAQKIGDVVQLISEIANQTNLLALNATIEAARAGEAGKGFAVVASEVKNLASQTAKATEEITTQISAMQSVAGEAVTAINGIGTTIERINSISASIAAAVEQQSAATGEIARNVQEAASGTKEVSSNIGAVTQAAGETGTVAGNVLQAASTLQVESGRLNEQVNAFIAKVRSA